MIFLCFYPQTSMSVLSPATTVQRWRRAWILRAATDASVSSAIREIRPACAEVSN